MPRSMSRVRLPFPAFKRTQPGKVTIPGCLCIQTAQAGTGPVLPRLRLSRSRMADSPPNNRYQRTRLRGRQTAKLDPQNSLYPQEKSILCRTKFQPRDSNSSDTGRRKTGGLRPGGGYTPRHVGVISSSRAAASLGRTESCFRLL